MRTPSFHWNHLALAFGLVAVTLSGACGSSSESTNLDADKRDGLADSPGYDADIVPDASVADAASPDLAAVDVTSASDTARPVDGGAVDVARSEVGSDVRADVGTDVGRPVDVGGTETGVVVDVAAGPEVGADASVQEAGMDPLDGGPAPSTPNLIVNGDAEAAAGSTDGSPVPTPGWTITDGATAIRYGVDGFAMSTDPGPANRGVNYFTGGVADVSTMSQTISLVPYASAIAGNAVSFILSGYIGSFSGQRDNAVVSLSFRNAGDVEVSKASIGPVTADDLEGATGLLFRSTTGAIPAAARSVRVTVTMTKFEGSSADGYADNLSLMLSGT